MEQILELVKNKNFYKTTTTLKFKEDVYNLMDNVEFEGDVLEVGCDTGNTTAILALSARKKGKKVYAYDKDQNRINQAQALLDKLEIDNCEFKCMNVYEEMWELPEIGFALIDCVHQSQAIIQDLWNVKNVSNNDVIIVMHDYGLMSREGVMETPVALDQTKDLYQVVNFLGEKKDWNPLGTGKAIDWEGVQLRIKK